MSWDSVLGHDDARKKFEVGFQSGRLASTFLFVGPNGIGKRTFSLTLAKTLLCSRRDGFQPCDTCPSCKQVNGNEHPDVQYVCRLPEKAQLTMEQIVGEKGLQNGFIHWVGKKPYYGDRKVAIIDDVDFLRIEGANALLKTLEEPPSGTMIILLGSSAQSQLSTIRSRSQLVRFSALDSNQVLKILGKMSLEADPDRIQAAAKASGGSVQNALNMLGEGVLEFRKIWLTRLASLSLTKGGFVKEATSFIEQAGKDATSKRSRITLLAGWGADFFRSLMIVMSDESSSHTDQLVPDPMLRKAAEAAKSHYKSGLYELTRAIDRCLESGRHVAANAHQATLLESWLIDLNHICHGGTPALPSLATHSPLSF